MNTVDCWGGNIAMIKKADHKSGSKHPRGLSLCRECSVENLVNCVYGQQRWCPGDSGDRDKAFYQGCLLNKLYTHSKHSYCWWDKFLRFYKMIGWQWEKHGYNCSTRWEKFEKGDILRVLTGIVWLPWRAWTAFWASVWLPYLTKAQPGTHKLQKH